MSTSAKKRVLRTDTTRKQLEVAKKHSEDEKKREEEIKRHPQYQIETPEMNYLLCEWCGEHINMRDITLEDWEPDSPAVAEMFGNFKTWINDLKTSLPKYVPNLDNGKNTYADNDDENIKLEKQNRRDMQYHEESRNKWHEMVYDTSRWTQSDFHRELLLL